MNNQRLIHSQRELLDGFIQLIARAIDQKSPYTGGHCTRVPVITEMLARAAIDTQEGPFRTFHLDDDQWYELHIAAWLHDCGKVTTPEFVVDKATKLETKYDRIHELRTRFELLKRDAEIDFLKQMIEQPDNREALIGERDRAVAKIEEEIRFLEEINKGGEFMSDEQIERLNQIAERRWIDWDNTSRNALSGNEIYNLAIRRGTLTQEERQIINDHIVVTIQMLESLPFPDHLSRVTEYAGCHHERVDGKGYPNGLVRHQMSIPARIMAIADVFEALTASDRPYKPAKKLSESLKIMSVMCAEGHIDQDLYTLFLTSGVYQKYAEEFLREDQVDPVNLDELLRLSQVNQVGAH